MYRFVNKRRLNNRMTISRVNSRRNASTVADIMVTDNSPEVSAKPSQLVDIPVEIAFVSPVEDMERDITVQEGENLSVTQAKKRKGARKKASEEQNQMEIGDVNEEASDDGDKDITTENNG